MCDSEETLWRDYLRARVVSAEVDLSFATRYLDEYAENTAVPDAIHFAAEREVQLCRARLAEIQSLAALVEKVPVGRRSLSVS